MWKKLLVLLERKSSATMVGFMRDEKWKVMPKIANELEAFMGKQCV